MDYLSYSLKPENLAAVAKATGTIPATDEAAALLPEYAEGGTNRIFMELSRNYAVMRPETPAYPFIATEYGKAVQDILAGADPKTALDKSVKAIDANIKSNGGYKN
jgi:multiple sugar transport system substrate-binding protein